MKTSLHIGTAYFDVDLGPDQYYINTWKSKSDLGICNTNQNLKLWSI